MNRIPNKGKTGLLCGNLTVHTCIELETINPYGLAEIDTISLDNFFYDAIVQFRSMLCCHTFENTIQKFQN